MSLELVTVRTADDKELDGAMYHPEGPRDSRTAILLVHGLTWNFYRGPCRWLAPLLAEAGFTCLSLNMRDHDLTEAVDFEQSHHDLRAGIDRLIAEGFTEVVVLTHGYACNKAACYAALSGDRRVRRYVLTTLGSVKSYRPDIWEKVLASAPAMPGRILVVQGADDHLIEAQPRADELVAAATGAKADVVMLQGGDHYFAATHESLANTVTDWLKRT